MEQIIIRHRDGTETPLFSRKRPTSVSRATQKTALLADDVVTISVTTSEPLPLSIGDTAEIYGRTYKLNQLPEPTKTGERRFSYELKFEGLQYDLIDVHYHLPEEAYGETFYADLAEHLRILVWNANRIFPGKWEIGNCPKDTEYKNITATGKNALQFLQEICSDYGVEFSITTDGKVNTINLNEKVGVTHAFTLQFGRGRGLYQLSRANVNNAGITNRLYVYGGNENLGNNYGHTVNNRFYPNNRLCLPGTNRLTSFIEDKASIAAYGVKEGEKTYSEVKPERVGTVTAIGKDVITFVDSEMFDLTKKKADGSTVYLIDGANAKIKFETGQLAGYEFDLHSYDHATHTFVINKFQDENGLIFPSDDNGAFQIGKGDKYIILDIQLPQEYIDKAEKELLEKANKYLPTVSQPQVSYKLSLTDSFFSAMFGEAVEVEVLHVGDYIQVKDPDIGVDKAVRITAIERDILKPHSYQITLSDTVAKTVTTRVLNDIEDINEVIAINKLADPSRARRRWRATQELLSMVFDPEGDYYSEKIKPLSIDTQMLSVGAKSTQFTLLNVRFEPNYGGNPNALYITDGGTLAHYAIDPDGVKNWRMTGGNFSGLSTNTPYYIYAICQRSGNIGNFTINPNPIKVEDTPNAYTFLVGVLNSVVTDANGKRPGRLVSLTYGSSTINGRFLRTGRIESSGGGKCYFDLDNDEIGGVIQFVNNEGDYINVSDLDEKAQETKDYINNTLPGILNDIQGQLDGQIEQFFYGYDPMPQSTDYSDVSSFNEPFATWYAELQGGESTAVTEHLGDLFYNTDTGKVFRLVEGFYMPRPDAARAKRQYWAQLSDEEAAQALALAQDALNLAGEKRRIFVTQPKPPYEVGDLWVQGKTGDIMRCRTARASGNFAASDWELASKYTDDTGLTNFINDNFFPTIEDLENQIDGKIETWYQTTDPATYWNTDTTRLKHVGDMWYNTNTKELKCYRRAQISATGSTTIYGYFWQKIEDAQAIAAHDAASKAQETADGKRQVFVTTPYPPYDVGDLWLREYTDNGVTKKELWRCVTERASGSYIANDWEEAVYYDNTKTIIDGGIVTSGTVQLAGSDAAIKAGITGQGTAEESVRIWAGATFGNRANAPFRVLQDGSFVASKGKITGEINANTGTIGGFTIGAGRIGTESSATGSSQKGGLALYDSFIKFADTYATVMMGTNVLPGSLGGLRALMRLDNSAQNQYSTNYGAIINVTGGMINLAIKATGALVSNSYVESYGFATYTPAVNNCWIPGDLTKPTIFRILIKFIYKNSGIGLPSRQAVAECLGISATTPFAVPITIICDKASTQTGYVIGRNTIITNSNGTAAMNSNSYPYRLNNNGGQETGKWNMAAGDIRQFMLVWDGSSNYYAYLLNIRE